MEKALLLAAILSAVAAFAAAVIAKLCISKISVFINETLRGLKDTTIISVGVKQMEAIGEDVKTLILFCDGWIIGPTVEETEKRLSEALGVKVVVLNYTTCRKAVGITSREKC